MDLIELGKLLGNIKSENIATLKNLLSGRDRIYLIGNGGSNAICSHIAQDYTKALGYRAECFSDGSRLTCYINDYGRDEAYAKYLEHFATQKSLVILISSSGNSSNILSAAEWCVQSDVPFVILSGFDEQNSLRKMYSPYAKLEFYVKSSDYGIVENLHSIFLHSVI
jgi:D-sedoheptulose 7-phosphate isomerase